MAATGGFTARAERLCLAVNPTSAEHVGPGAYNVRDSSPGAAGMGPVPVPFLSTLDRVLLENTGTSAFTPGPGAYQTGKALDSLQLRHVESLVHSANFASATSRLHADKSNVGKPGPGAYDSGNAWLKHRHQFSAPSTSRQRVSQHRVPSAPSIPDRHQSYGYEEGKGGDLVMQRPPDPVHTGVGRDTVGPGAYDLGGGVDPSPRSVQWGNSRTRRGLQVASTTPGPGQYETAKANANPAGGIVVSIGGVDVQFGGASGSSAFASKVPIKSQCQPREWERTPGPGAYNIQGGPQGTSAMPKELQFFGSSARRGFDVDPTRSLSAPTYFKAPGPGAYNPPHEGVRIMQQSVTDPRPFNATSTRFGSNATGTPGPGEYQVPNLAQAAADKAAASKGGVFGSNATRWTSQGRQQEANLPGPANYEPKPDQPKPRHKGNAAMFQSKTDRFRAPTTTTSLDVTDYDPASKQPPKGDPGSLGPGSYQMPDPWAKSKAGARHALAVRAPGFGSDAQRSKMNASSLDTPGPGRYNTIKNVDAAFKPLSIPNKESVFGTQVPRFKGHDSYAPGPGHYQLGGDMARRSFNITYAQDLVSA